MSLHLGNLSSRIRRDELLRVFRRFGRCTLQVKDKFGFVIYEYPANAEEALRTLRGQKICGERITLAWSNRQPRPLQRHARGGRTYEAPRGRQYGREDYSNRNLGSDSRDGNRRGFRQVDRSGGRVDSAELIAESTGHQLNNREGYSGDKHHDFVQALPDEGGGVEVNLLENDRWEEQVAGNGLENELDFDRYEPYHGDDGKEQEDILTSNHLGDSFPVRKSEEKQKTNQIDHQTVEGLHDSKSQKSCYLCGEVGHRMRKCPQELKRLSTRSGGQLVLDRDASPAGKHRFHREASTSRIQQKLLGHADSPVGGLTHRVRKKEEQGKKRSRRENPTPETHESKKARIPLSSSIHSDYTASRSRSLSRSGMSISGSRSHTRSKSVPSRSNSMDSRSRSASTPSPPRSRKLKFRSNSGSSTPKSLGPPLPSSPGGVQMNQQDALVNYSGLELEETSVQVEPVLKSDALSDNSKLGIVTAGVKNESSVALLNVEEDLTDNSLRRDDVGNYSIAGDVRETQKSCIPQSDDSDHNAGNLSQKSLREMRECTSNDFDGDGKSVQIKNSEMEVSGRLHAANLMNISSKEICMVFKNSGLEHPHENEKDLPPEIYFGSARLWPWEFIYYRRLKKGPISKQNYARRLAQNKEFGIVDKYIRSSSSWGELSHENP